MCWSCACALRQTRPRSKGAGVKGRFHGLLWELHTRIQAEMLLLKSGGCTLPFTPTPFCPFVLDLYMCIEADTPSFKRCGCKRKVLSIHVGAVHVHSIRNAGVQKVWVLKKGVVDACWSCTRAFNQKCRCSKGVGVKGKIFQFMLEPLIETDMPLFKRCRCKRKVFSFMLKLYMRIQAEMLMFKRCGCRWKVLSIHVRAVHVP